MKILNINQIREGDQYTIKHEPIASIDLMERAATNCTQWILDNYPKDLPVSIFAGPGNNGGDGLVIARLLKETDYQVKLYIVEYTQEYSLDFKINLERIEKAGIKTIILNQINNKFNIGNSGLLIDAIFGSGLSRPIEGFTADIIKQINESSQEVVSVDIASGLMADRLSEEKELIIIKPKHTLSIAFPKLAFFLPENECYVGQWHPIDISIHPDYSHQAKAFAYYLQEEDIRPLIKKRAKYAHKGSFGHALLIAGSRGKMGAAVLSSQAALRTGLGLLTTHLPLCGVNILQTSVPEAMVSIDEHNDHFSKTPDIAAFNAIAIGPGLGLNKASQNAFKLLIQNSGSPLVIDADALNILSQNKTWLAFLPSGSILTPHPKEFDRLAGISSSSLERIKKQTELSRKHNIFIILKGAHTSVSTPDGKLFFNSTGNPGMATAGSGDVLTGIILSLLAQAYAPQTACILGVYLHGLAGDIAAFNKGFEAMLASDITEQIGAAFIKLQL